MKFGEIFLCRFAVLQGAAAYLAGALLCSSFLAGCASTGIDLEPTQQSLKSQIQKADGELAAGHRDKAIELLNQAAKKNPASMVPWLKIADIWFESGNYPSSILAANEVLQRDAKNQEAKSILVVAGLRVAAGAVTGLRANSKVDTSSRAEAENLTKVLRDVLGEKVLVPAPPIVQAKPEARPVRHRPRGRHAAKTHDAASNTPASDPFRILK